MRVDYNFISFFMKTRLFVLGLMLFNLCALQAQEDWVITWKVNNVEYASTGTWGGFIFDDIPAAPIINCDKEFVGWTQQKNYNSAIAPYDLFDSFYEEEITTHTTFHAVFAGEESGVLKYTTYNCYEDLQFIQNDTTISITHALSGNILFIHNQDASIGSILIYSGNDIFNKHAELHFTNSGTYLTADIVGGPYVVQLSLSESNWKYRLVTTEINFYVRDDSRTITYYGFNDNWCADVISHGGIKNIGDTFIVSTQAPFDPEGLGRQFINWNTSTNRQSGNSYEPGDTIIIASDMTLYPQWIWEITSNQIAPESAIFNTDVIIKGGGTLLVGDKYSVNTLHLEGGLNTAGTAYNMPALYIASPSAILIKKNSENLVHFDLSINQNNYYPFAVPFPVQVSNIDYADPVLAAVSTYGKHYVIKRYDGALRAEHGENKDSNWVKVEAEETLQPGVGYIITAVPVGGKAIIRIPLVFSNTWTTRGEQANIKNETLNRNIVPAIAHIGTAANANKAHAGWNFVANPYLSKYDGQDIQNAPTYACIPKFDFSKYDQVILDEQVLSAEYPFFVQVDDNTILNFSQAGIRQAPAAVRANENSQTLFATFNILRTDNQKMDHTGIVLNDDYTPAYEINADLEKMFGSAYTTSLYSINQNIKLAYNAMSHKDAQSSFISMGYRAEEAGQYTIALENPEDLLEYENVLLHDNLTNITTNLLYTDYTFDTERTQDDSRFTIQFIGRHNTATDIANIYSTNTSTTKIIKDNQLYIIRDGQTYNAAGILVE